MKFRKKPMAVDAFQFDGDLKNSHGEYYVSEWAVASYLKGDIFFYSSEESGACFYKSPLGRIPIEVGDYIVHHDGTLCPYPQEMFEVVYEQISEGKVEK